MQIYFCFMYKIHYDITIWCRNIAFFHNDFTVKLGKFVNAVYGSIYVCVTSNFTYLNLLLNKALYKLLELNSVCWTKKHVYTLYVWFKIIVNHFYFIYAITLLLLILYNNNPIIHKNGKLSYQIQLKLIFKLKKKLHKICFWFFCWLFWMVFKAQYRKEYLLQNKREWRKRFFLSHVLRIYHFHILVHFFSNSVRDIHSTHVHGF